MGMLSGMMGGIFLFGFLAYLISEKIILKRWHEEIPVRICITGTRGKSSVARLIGAGLRKNGWRVVVKTTGSKPMIIDPEGNERPVPRYGPPSVLEQRSVLGLARKWKARALVMETMSIKPENLLVEIRHILSPNYVVVTNIRPDHVDDLGPDAQALCAILGRSIPSQATVFMPDCERMKELTALLRQRGVNVIQVETHFNDAVPLSTYIEWKTNLALAIAACQALGVEKTVALKGMERSNPDFGALKIWHVKQPKEPNRRWSLVSAFAANDPISTGEVLKRIQTQWSSGIVGILNLRADRADRSQQWYHALLSERFNGVFSHLLLVGHAPYALVFKLIRHYNGVVEVIPKTDPQVITKKAFSCLPNGGTIFGFGNIKGVGAALVEYWAQIGSNDC